jgi:hypothetical protein
MTEAVAVFHDVKSFQAAIDDLLSAGFDHADINVLAHEDTVTSKLGPSYKSAAEFEDDPIGSAREYAFDFLRRTPQRGTGPRAS